MRHWTKRCLALFLVLFLCTGCAASGSGGTKENGDTKEGGDTEGSAEQNPADGTVEENSDRALRVGQIIHLPIEDPEEEFTSKNVYPGSFGSKLYLLASYQFGEGEQPAMWLYTYDLDTQETEKTSFSLEVPNLENFFMDSMTVTGKNELTFRLHGSSEGSDTVSYFLCRTNLAGKPLDGDEPLSEDTGYPPAMGNFFAVSDGAPILVEREGSETRLSRYDTESLEPVPMTVVDDFVNTLCSDGKGGLYYIGGSELKHLDLDTMDEVILCSIAGSGIKLSVDSFLLAGKEGELAVCSVSFSDPTVYLLTDQEDDREREDIRLVNIDPHEEPLWAFNLANAWSFSSDSYRITTEAADIMSQAMSALRDRTMAELASGKGPEIMFVSEDDLHILAEKGALMDMSELINEDVRGQILPGVLQLGTVDGVWVGIPGWIECKTLMVSDALWSGDSWKASDILDIAESRDGWGEWTLGEITGIDRDFDRPLTPPDSSKLFEIGFSRSLGDSPFMDVENGISYFNGEEFIRVMEFCREHGYTGNVTADVNSVAAMLGEGRTIAHLVDLDFGIQDFSREMASHENCHMVGFPNESGSGNYVSSRGYFVVNSDADHIEGIKDFLNYMYSYDMQHGNLTPIRKDVLRDQITIHPQYGWPAILKDPSDKDNIYSYGYIELKPDGTSYLEEFMDFMESCVPMPYCPTAITEIVEEELGAYFAGNRNAKDTADIIHRRAQLYFDEHK